MSLANPRVRVRKPTVTAPKAGVDYKVVTLRLDPHIWQSFQAIARDNGQSIVGRLRVMVRRDVEESTQVETASA
jgi:hypothetical protein